ncbi:MAG: hypothetical protein ACRET0_14985, partial [Steroidobacteraceae bacterium]
MTAVRRSYLTARREAEQLSLELSGDWHARNFGQIEAELGALDLSGLRAASIAASQAHLDLTGAWLLRDFLRRARDAGVHTRFADAAPPTLLLVDRTLTGEVPEQTEHIEWLEPATALEDIGRHTVRWVRDLVAAVAFLGRAITLLLRALSRPSRLRPISVARHVYDTGISAVPIVALIAFLVSVILAYLGA